MRKIMTMKHQKICRWSPHRSHVTSSRAARISNTCKISVHQLICIVNFQSLDSTLKKTWTLQRFCGVVTATKQPISETLLTFVSIETENNVCEGKKKFAQPTVSPLLYNLLFFLDKRLVWKTTPKSYISKTTILYSRTKKKERTHTHTHVYTRAHTN